MEALRKLSLCLFISEGEVVLGPEPGWKYSGLVGLLPAGDGVRGGRGLDGVRVQAKLPLIFRLNNYRKHVYFI